MEDGESSFETDKIVRKWELDYTNLYACRNPSSFDNQFLSEISNLKDELERGMSNTAYCSNYMLNGDISIEEVQRVVDKAKLNKAVGVDELPNEVLKNPSMLNILHCLFQNCFQYGILPSTWSKSIIKPIPKSAFLDPRVPLNYRGISLISTVYKLYSGVLNDRLSNYLETYGVLVDEQNGFRKNRACIDHIYTITSVVRARLQEGKNTFACFVDFQKAFDWVNRDLLEYKLLCSGIDGKFYNAIKVLYKAPVACLQINNLRTSWFPTPFGVKQGDVLSPTLFALYVNDLAQEIKQVNLGIPIDDVNLSILLYADDIVLVAVNEINLQKMLNIMSLWCSKWQLVINSEKTQVLHFRKPCEQLSDHIFQFGIRPLKYATSYKYLGFVFNENMTFSNGSKSLAESAGRALGSIMCKMKACPDLGFLTFSKLYDSMVGSILFYAAGVWGFKNSPDSNAIQARAMRCFLGVHKYTAKGAIEGDMGWVSCLVKQRCEIARLWNRLVQLPDERLTKNIFNWDRRHNYPWAKEVAALFSFCDLNDIFRNNLQCNINIIKEKLIKIQIGQWKEEIWAKPKLRNYVQIKEGFHTELYITFNLRRGQRSLCAQLRSGTLPLAIEVGRYKGIPEEQRLCVLCDLNVVEDEYHFLFHCPVYCELRNCLFEKIQLKNPDLFWLSEGEMLRWLFNEETFAMARFVENAWHLRQRTLYPI